MELRGKRWKIITISFLLVLMAFCLFAGGKSEKEQPKEQPVESGNISVLKIGVVNDQGTTDMFKEHGVEGLMMKQLIYNGLTELDKNFAVVPGLAKKWEISDDGLEYTFYLREGVNFHNGREMTAEDVKWTYEKYIDPDTGYPYKGDFDMITKIEIIDDYTIKLTIKEQNSTFLSGIASGVKPILAKESYSVDDAGLLVLEEVIGTGPYEFVEWIQDSQFKLKAFEEYWAGKPNVENIVFEIIPESTVRLSALQAGDLDLIRNPPFNNLVQYMNDKPDEPYVLDVMPGTQSFTHNFTFNHVEGPFTDKRVRQAVMLGIDLSAYTKIVTKGIGENANGPFPKGNIWASNVTPPKQNVEKAKQLLSEAGYQNGLEITVLAAPSMNLDKHAEIAQAQLSEIGITLNVEVVEIGRYFDRESRMDWDLKAGAHSISVDPAVLWNLVLRTESPAWWWMGKYGKKEIDILLDKGIETTNIAERQKIYNEIYKIIQDDAGIIWLYNLPITYGHRKNLSGISFNTRGDLIYSNNQGVPWITKK